MRISIFYSAFRHFVKDKVYAAINLFGLAVGLAGTMLIAGYVIYELSYDRFYPRHRQIFRIYSDGTWSGKSLREGHTPFPLADAMQRDFPEVESATRCQVFWNRSVRYEDKHFYEDRFFYADSNFIEFFGYRVLSGNPKSLLSAPNSIVMTASASQRYFGSEDPVGRAIRIENNFGNDTAVYTVTGIIEDLPSNSHLKIDMVASMNTNPYLRTNNWLGGGFFTYIRLDRMADPGQLNSKIDKSIAGYIAPDLQRYLNLSVQDYLNSKDIYTFHFQPVSDIYMNAGISDGLTEHGNSKQTYILASIAVFILILACVNFTNLSTARATVRAREIGIRKISGAKKGQIALLFLGEVFMHVCAATFIALILVDILQIPFARIMDRNFRIIDFNPYFISGLAALMVITTLFAGSYPAFLLSSFQPLSAIHGKIRQFSRGMLLRTILILIQFTLSVATAIAAITVYRQMIYLEKFDLGFNRENMVIIERTDPLRGQVEPFINDLKKIPEIQSVSISSGVFGRPLYQTAFSREGKNPEDLVFFHGTNVDYEFNITYDLPVTKGRWFSRDFSDSNAVIINETAAKVLDWDEPVGMRLFNPDGRRTYSTIVGVVKDFNFESLHTPIQPFIFFLNPSFYDGYYSVRFKADDREKVIQKVKGVWERFTRDDVLVYYYYDQEFNRIYGRETAAKNIMAVFTVLAIFISCLGLLGMASYTTGKRTKEVGIRKSMGADSISIIGLFAKHMLFIVFVANLIAWPLAWIGTKKWLNDFAYRVDQNLYIHLMVMAAALILCMLTIIYHVVRVAESNPVDALRYE